MNAASLLGDMLQAITERGRRFLALGARDRAHEPLAALAACCHTLLSSRGEASGMALAEDILQRWERLDAAQQTAFLQTLLHDFGPDVQKLEAAMDEWRSTRSSRALPALHRAAEPKRQELIRRLNLAPNGTCALVRMREVLLQCAKTDADLAVVDADFAHLFASWFNRGFLQLRPMTWASPAHILEKLILHEAVHHISGWDELRRRLAPQDRRCFAFFHPQLPDEPLIFVEVALTRGIPARIDDILDEAREPIRAAEATTAVFYSISNCQPGLRGVTFGNFLIKQVVQELGREVPGLTHFVTLSPVPGFAAWLRNMPRGTLGAEHEAQLARIDADGHWLQENAPALQNALLAAAAYYFLHSRDAKGRITDPVARFHLGNGARLERINALADRSARALRQSHGLMVNYLYKLDDIESNHEACASRGEVVATAAIRRLLPRPLPKTLPAMTKTPLPPASGSNPLFDAMARAAADKQARLLETPDGKRWTYGDMLQFSARLALSLRQSGVEPGARVAVQVEKSAEALMLYLACLRAGAVYLPLNTAYTLTELEYLVGDARPSLLVCTPQAQAGLAPLAKALGAMVHTMDAQGGGSLLALAREHTPQDVLGFSSIARTHDDLAAILYTSGTTGRPKGAMLTHGNLLSNALALRDHWRFDSGDTLIHALPIFHIHGLFVACNVTLLSGAAMIWLPKFDPDAVLQHMAHATVLMGVPTFYVRLLQHPGLNKKTAARMRLFISGSAPLLEETHQRFAQKTGHAILERYGMSETGMNASNPYEGARIAGTVGQPLPGVNIRITDPQSGSPLPMGETGMIEVKGPNVFAGYWGMPEKTRAEFRPDGFFMTGDLGLMDERGYLHIVGRSKDLVICGGYNVYPKEVESEINALDGVLESAVIGLPHPDLGEAVTAVVVCQPRAALDENTVLAGIHGRLARYKQPRRVLFIPELPRNTMGKVQKNRLREAFSGLYGASR